MNWSEWPRGYDRWPPLQARLRAVQRQIAGVLISHPPGPIRVISLCAGDGRDLIGALSEHRRAGDVQAWLIETNAELVTQGEAATAHFGLSSHVHFNCSDATLSDTYLDIALADLVLIAGVFGNVQEAGEEALVRSLCCLCRANGFVIWTRGVGNADGEQAAERIRRHFSESGFRERVLARPVPAGFLVGTHRFIGAPQPLTRATRLFEFTGYDRLNGP